MILRHWLPLTALCLLVTGSAHAWSFSVSTSGNNIMVSVTGMDNSNGAAQTCAGASVDLPPGGASCGRSTYENMTLTCNRIGAHTVYVDVADATTNGYETRQTTVTLTEPPSLACGTFGLESGYDILTHKWGTGDPYPFRQTGDHQVEVLFRWINVEPGTPMYVRVFDADDPSSYRTWAPAVDDNLDSGAGTLSTSPSETGAKQLTFAVGSDPIQKIYLNTTGFAAGDNYTIRASLNPNLLSDPSVFCSPALACQQWWPMTAWKRVYLEKKEMFRSGVFIARETPAGSNEVLVQVPTGLSWNDVVLRPGDEIRLLHAPRLDGLDFVPEFHSEEAFITAVDHVAGNNARRLLTLAAPLKYSYIDDRSYLQALQFGVSDAVGNLAAGTYERNESYLHTSFVPMFVQFWTVPQRVQQIPYLPVIRRTYHFANKWFENTPVNVATWARPGNPNVKHVLTGSATFDPPGRFTFGETGVHLTNPPPSDSYIPQANLSWTFLGTIERVVVLKGNPYRNVNALNFNGENLVHELAHTFNVNSVAYFGNDFGHCNRTMATNSALGCKMRSSEDPAHVPAESGDGILGFHYSADTDSEYMTIRRALEPLATPVK